jgi:hypothetical protein
MNFYYSIALLVQLILSSENCQDPNPEIDLQKGCSIFTETLHTILLHNSVMNDTLEKVLLINENDSRFGAIKLDVLKINVTLKKLRYFTNLQIFQLAFEYSKSLQNFDNRLPESSALRK